MVGLSFQVAEETVDPEEQTHEQMGVSMIEMPMVLLRLGSFVPFPTCELRRRGPTPGRLWGVFSQSAIVSVLR